MKLRPKYGAGWVASSRKRFWKSDTCFNGPCFLSIKFCENVSLVQWTFSPKSGKSEFKSAIFCTSRLSTVLQKIWMNQNGILPLVSSITMIDEWSLGQTTMLKVNKTGERYHLKYSLKI